MPSGLPPGPRAPRYLNTLKWQRRPTEFVEEARERYGDVWTLRLSGGTTFVLVSDPELLEVMFEADPDWLHGGESKRQVAEALLGPHSVLLVDGSEHGGLRGLLLPPFHRERMPRYRDLMEQFCEQELATWPVGEPIELLPRMQTITLNVIMSAIFGATQGGLRERLRARIHDLHGFSSNPWHMLRLFLANTRGKSPPASFARIRASLDEVIYEAIGAARADPRLAERDDILAILVQARHENGSPMTDATLRDQLMTLFVQGHTSTAATLAWALERLTRRPEAFERVAVEARDGKEGYLDAVLKETLRLYPTIPITTRLVKRPFPLGDYEIPAGLTLVANTYMLHHRGDLYPEPDRFLPERFLEQEPDSYTWIPFGAGDRYCLGRSFATAEIKAVLRTLALHARLEPAEQAHERPVRRGTTISPKAQARAVLRERVAAP